MTRERYRERGSESEGAREGVKDGGRWAVEFLGQITPACFIQEAKRSS